MPTANAERMSCRVLLSLAFWLTFCGFTQVRSWGLALRAGVVTVVGVDDILPWSKCNRVWWGFWQTLHLWTEVHFFPELRQLLQILWVFNVDNFVSWHWLEFGAGIKLVLVSSTYKTHARINSTGMWTDEFRSPLVMVILRPRLLCNRIDEVWFGGLDTKVQEIKKILDWLCFCHSNIVVSSSLSSKADVMKGSYPMELFCTESCSALNSFFERWCLQLWMSRGRSYLVLRHATASG